MIKEIIEEIKIILSKEKNSLITKRIEEKSLFYLLYLKYLYDEKTYTLEELTSDKINDEIKDTCIYKTFTNSNYVYYNKLNKLLTYIINKDLKELLIEYLELNKNSLNLYSGKVLLYSTELSIKNYDLEGNTTYLLDNNYSVLNLDIIKFYDKVLNINSKFINEKDINYNDYDILYCYNELPRYRFIKDGISYYEEIKKALLINDNLKVIYQTNYEKISNLRNSSLILRKISHIIIGNNYDSYLLLDNNNHDTISIINYDEKIKTKEELYKIILKNRKQKNILIKTTRDEIKDNNYRIGFSLYKDNSIVERKSINYLIDQNSKLIERLNNINEIINVETNKLLNK